MKKKMYWDPNRESTDAEFMVFIESAIGFEMVEQHMLDVMEKLRHLNGPAVDALTKLLCHVRDRALMLERAGK